MKKFSKWFKDMNKRFLAINLAIAIGIGALNYYLSHRREIERNTSTYEQYDYPKLDSTQKQIIDRIKGKFSKEEIMHNVHILSIINNNSDFLKEQVKNLKERKENLENIGPKVKRFEIAKLEDFVNELRGNLKDLRNMVKEINAEVFPSELIARIKNNLDQIEKDLNSLMIL